MGLSFILCLSTAVLLLRIPRGHSADITGGEESIPQSRRYMAALMTGNTLCGGTVIKQDWVLTAAHCNLIKGTTKVILGAHSLKDKREQQRFNIVKLVRHPHYDNKSLRNDIMLLKINRRRKSELVKTIRLVKPRAYIRPGQKCLVAGWGHLHSTSKRISDTLHEVNVTVFDSHICNDMKHWDTPVVTKDRMCAGDKDGGKDACNGDSGGPLICKGRQAGIVSFGKGCGDRKYPGIYTRLTKDYLTWIRQTIKGLL